MPEFLLATKLYIPPVRDNLVSRPRLVQRLNDALAQNHRLTLISAPAGYGKSTLLSEWVSQLDLPVAWLTLESRENQPARFWTYFTAAMSTIPSIKQAGIGASLRQALLSPKPAHMDTLLDDLLNELAGLSAGAVLVLDDLHNIAESTIHRDLVYLIDHLPQSAHHLRLVVASRMDPPWPLARWRVREELSELRPSDLRFSNTETAQLLNRILGLGLSLQEMAVLQKRTEGWIAGLQMAAITMQERLRAQGNQGVTRFIDTFTGTNRFIMDYLVEEVIHQQPDERRDFLQATSILEQFTAPLCDALLERQDSQRIIDQLEQANLFLISLDDNRHWYRYHRLFADLLLKGLKQSHPERISGLHLRASAWYAQNNLLTEAINHALDAGDMVQLNKYISGNALAMVEYTELLDVLAHFEQMSEEEICSRPWLCVAYAWVKAYVDPSGEMDRTLVKAMQSVNCVEDELEKQHLISHLDAVWAYVAWVKGRADLALEFAHSAFDTLPEDDWLTRAHLHNIEGLALQYLDCLPAAIQSFEEAVAAGQRTGKPRESFHAYTNWAFSEILRGRLRQAYALCQHVLDLADQAGIHSKKPPVLAYAYATMSIVQREWNQLPAAVATAQEGLVLAEQWNQADTLHFCLTCLSEALCSAGDYDGALAVNQRAMQLAVMASPWFVKLSLFTEISINLSRGDLAAAAHRFKEVASTGEQGNQDRQYLLIQASLLHAQGRYADTLAVLDKSIDEFIHKEKIWASITALSLQALALQALGREDEALEAIARCLAYAAPEGCVRIFVERGSPMLKLLQQAAKSGIQREYIHQLLPAFDLPPVPEEAGLPGVTTKASQSQGEPLLDPLSQRELEVLRMLDSALTSEEIGRELFISTNTVRTHIKNIYSKLGVNRRAQAVQFAKKLKLM